MGTPPRPALSLGLVLARVLVVSCALWPCGVRGVDGGRIHDHASRAFDHAATWPLVVPAAYDPALEPLADKLRAVANVSSTVHGVRAAYTAALDLFPLDGTLSVGRNPYGELHPMYAAWELATAGLQLIAASGRVVPCHGAEPSLPLDVTGSSGRYLLASNVHQCEHMMANYVLQLLRVRPCRVWAPQAHMLCAH